MQVQPNDEQIPGHNYEIIELHFPDKYFVS